MGMIGDLHGKHELLSGDVESVEDWEKFRDDEE